MDRRNSEDREKTTRFRPTLFHLFGRRRNTRSVEDRQKSPYTDRHGPVVFFFLVLLMGLNILDSLFTIMILEIRGKEVNPIVRTAMDLYGSNFWVWKFAIVSLCAILLCMHSKYRVVKGIIIALCSIYFSVVLYQVLLLNHL